QNGNHIAHGVAAVLGRIGSGPTGATSAGKPQRMERDRAAEEEDGDRRHHATDHGKQNKDDSGHHAHHGSAFQNGVGADPSSKQRLPASREDRELEAPEDQDAVKPSQPGRGARRLPDLISTEQEWPISATVPVRAPGPATDRLLCRTMVEVPSPKHPRKTRPPFDREP